MAETSMAETGEKCSKHYDRNDMVRLAVDILESEKDYQLISVLGRGTYGDVFRMYDPERNEDIAAKIVTPDNTSDKELIFWPKLHHRNIVPLLELLTLRPMATTIFIMPLQKKNLHDVLCDKHFLMRRGCFKRVKQWMFEILAALEYLRSKQFCHLDIKVDNVLISHRSTAMLCDFSFLNVTIASLKRYDLGLPFIYRPPEACQSLGKEIFIDGRSYDMWGYGVMVVEILTQFVLATNVADSNCWIKDVYPTLFEALQEAVFVKTIRHTFPSDEINEYDVKLTLNFIHGFLVTDCSNRASPDDAMRHVFLNHGNATGYVADEIWIHKRKDSSVCMKKPQLTSDDNCIDTHINGDAETAYTSASSETHSEISEDLYLILTGSDQEENGILYRRNVLISSISPRKSDEINPSRKEELFTHILDGNEEKLPLQGERISVVSKEVKIVTPRNSDEFRSTNHLSTCETEVISGKSNVLLCNEDNSTDNESDICSHKQQCDVNESNSQNLTKKSNFPQYNNGTVMNTSKSFIRTTNSDSMTKNEHGYTHKKELKTMETSTIELENQNKLSVKQLEFNLICDEHNKTTNALCNLFKTEEFELPETNDFIPRNSIDLRLKTDEKLCNLSSCETTPKDSSSKEISIPFDLLDSGTNSSQVIDTETVVNELLSFDVNTVENTEVKWATGDFLQKNLDKSLLIKSQNISSTSESLQAGACNVRQDVAVEDFDVSQEVRDLRGKLCELDKIFGQLEKTLVCESCSQERNKSDNNVNTENIIDRTLSNEIEVPTERRSTRFKSTEIIKTHMPQKSSLESGYADYSEEPLEHNNSHDVASTIECFSDKFYEMNTSIEIKSQSIQITSLNLIKGEDSTEEENPNIGRGRKFRKWLRERCLDIERLAQRKPYRILK